MALGVPGVSECSHESRESLERRESLGHAEQLLFLRVNSKEIVCHAVICHKLYVICQMLILILGTISRGTAWSFLKLFR